MVRDFLRGRFINGLIAPALVLGAMTGIALFNGAQISTEAPPTPIEFRFA